jgi:hypothetical protein
MTDNGRSVELKAEALIVDNEVKGVWLRMPDGSAYGFPLTQKDPWGKSLKEMLEEDLLGDK